MSNNKNIFLIFMLILFLNGCANRYSYQTDRHYKPSPPPSSVWHRTIGAPVPYKNEQKETLTTRKHDASDEINNKKQIQKVDLEVKSLNTKLHNNYLVIDYSYFLTLSQPKTEEFIIETIQVENADTKQCVLSDLSQIKLIPYGMHNGSLSLPIPANIQANYKILLELKHAESNAVASTTSNPLYINTK